MRSMALKRPWCLRSLTVSAYEKDVQMRLKGGTLEP